MDMITRILAADELAHEILGYPTLLSDSTINQGVSTGMRSHLENKNAG